MKFLALAIALSATAASLCAQNEATPAALPDTGLSAGGGNDARPSPERIAQLKKSVGHVMALSETEVIALVPRESRGIRWTTCPQCRKRSRSANWNWAPERPHEVTCADCGTVFPNAKYPDDHFLEVAAPGGTHRFAYYEETAPAKAGEASRAPKVIRRFFRATADYRAKGYLTQCALALATLYQATGEERYAGRALLILAEFARVFPGWPAVFDGEWMDSTVRFVPYNGLTLEALHHNDRTGRWEYWSVMDISTELLTAYDRLRNWSHWKTPDGAAAALRIERDLFGEQISHVLRFPETHTGNMAITVKWPSLLTAARVLRQPALFHETLRKVEHFLDTAFLYDGGWWETSPSYAQQIVTSGLARVPRAAHGYSDPPGYADPQTGRRFDHLDLHRLPAFVRAERVLAETRLPDGRLLPLNDTWPTDRSAAGPRDETKSTLFPGFGVAVLGAGRGAAQMHAWLDFTPGVSHKHAGALSIGLYAGGKELLTDLGYTHSHYRAWAISTMAHNTVVVNGRESQHDSSYSGHRVRAFVSDGRVFHLAAVESKSAYAEIADEYARTLVLIGTDARDGYLIDLFDARGGTQHDYLLHGSADENSHAALDGVALEPFSGSLLNAGATFAVPAHQNASSGGAESAYGFVHDLRRGVSSGAPIDLTMRLEQNPSAGFRSHLVADRGDELFLGEAPSIRRIGGSHLREDESQVYRFQAPLLCWRRQGAALASRFIAVHQPRPTAVPIASVKATRLASGALLLRIDRAGAGADYFLKCDAASDALSEARTPDGMLSFRGEHGWLRVTGGRVTHARLMGQGHLRLGGFAMEETSGRFTGKVRAVGDSDDATAGAHFDVSEALPADSHYSTIVVTFSDGTERAYTISRVSALEATPGSRIEVRESLGFAINPAAMEWRSYPRRSIGGTEISYTLSTWKLAGAVR